MKRLAFPAPLTTFLLSAALVCGLAPAALGQEDPRVSLHVKALDDARVEIRVHAARRLGLMGAKALRSAPRLLLLAKSDPATPVRLAATSALGAVLPRGQTAPAELLELLGANVPDSIRLAACVALTRLSPKPESCVVALRRVLRDSAHATAKIRAQAARALGVQGRGAAPALGALCAGLASPSASLRQASMLALRSLGPTARGARGEIERVLRDRGEAKATREYAVAALARFGSVGRGAVVWALLQRPTHSEARSALLALGKEGRLALQLTEGGFRGRTRAAKRLRALGSKAAFAVPALAHAVRQRTWGPLTLAALRTLGGIGPDAQAALPAVMFALAQKDSGTRVAAARALAGMRPRAYAFVLRPLRRLLRSEVELEVEAALEGLGGLGALQEPVLEAVHLRLRWGNEPVRRAAAKLLGKQPKLPRGALVTLAGAVKVDRSWKVRLSALRALGRLGVGNPEARAAARGALSDSKVEVASLATRALAALRKGKALSVAVKQAPFLARVQVFHPKDSVVRPPQPPVAGEVDSDGYWKRPPLKTRRDFTLRWRRRLVPASNAPGTRETGWVLWSVEARQPYRASLHGRLRK